MKIAIASDMEGFSLKTQLVAFLRQKGHELLDKGEKAEAAACAALVASPVMSGESGAGILISATGVGVSAAANKFEGIKASVCPDTYAAGRGAREEGMNVLCLGAGSVGVELAKELSMSFIKAIPHRKGTPGTLE